MAVPKASQRAASASASTVGDSGVAIEVEHLGIEFLSQVSGSHTAFSDISLQVKQGEFVAIVGPTGCGKSTLLNAMAGLLPPTSGRITVFGQRMRGVNPRATYLFQREQLLPWLTARDNVELGFRFNRKLPRAERARQVSEWLKNINLEKFGDRYPAQLSGGMRKRVAIAQTWVSEPEIILMDEPFSALDVHTRQHIEANLLEIWEQQRNTVVFVTHDLEEAISLADRVVVLSAGPDSHVVGEFPVSLERPRDLLNMRTTAAFTEMYRTIWGALRQEVLRSYED